MGFNLGFKGLNTSMQEEQRICERGNMFERKFVLTAAQIQMATALSFV